MNVVDLCHVAKNAEGFQQLAKYVTPVGGVA